MTDLREFDAVYFVLSEPCPSYVALPRVTGVATKTSGRVWLEIIGIQPKRGVTWQEYLNRDQIPRKVLLRFVKGIQLCRDTTLPLGG